MTGTQRFTLAYCSQNQSQVNAFETDLQKAGFEFQSITCTNDADGNSFKEKLENAQGHILFFLSDNLLKSADCLAGIYGTIQQLIRNQQLTTIVLDGHSIKEDGTLVVIPTKFDRVSHVIQYMNFWQDKYLDVRKEKRNADPSESPAYDEQLKLIRSISAEIGELLRFIRNANYFSLEAISAKDYELFFELFNNKHLYIPFKEQQELQKARKLSTVSSEQNVDEAIEEPDNIGDIPGMDLLNETSSLGELSTDPSPETTHSPDNSASDETEKMDPNEKNEEENDLSDYLTNPESSFFEEKEELKSDASDFSSFQNRNSDLENVYKEDMDDDIPQEDFGDFKDTFIPSPESELDPEETDPSDEMEELFADDEPNSTKDKEAGQHDEIPASEVEANEMSNQVEDDDNDNDNDKTNDDDEPLAIDAALSSSNGKLTENAPEKTTEESTSNPEVAQIAQTANFLIQAGEVDQALGLMKVIVKKYPEDIDARFQYAVILADYKKDQDSAVSQFKKVIEYKSDHFQAYLRLAEIAELNEDYLAAIDYYKKIKEHRPNLPDIDYKLGLLHQTALPDQKEEILGYFKKAVQIDPTNVDAYYRYATLLSEMPEKSDKAVKAFKKTLKIDPDHPFANYDLALLYHQQEDWEKAAKFYNRAAEINPELKNETNDQAFRVDENGDLIQETEEKADSAFFVSGTSDKVVCVTGATSGIGKATAEVFARQGYKVLLVGRRADRLEALQTQFKEYFENNQIETLTFDVRKLDAAQQALESLDESWQNIDILINNAGLAKGLAPIHEGNIEHWDTMIDTNIKGLLYMTRLVSPGMVERKKGHIINVCSIAGKEVYPQGNVYCATKFAVDALTKGMRIDLHEHNIRVSQVSPGHVEETEFALVRFDGNEERAKIYNDFNPLTSSDVAESIFYIATRPDHVNIQDVVMTGTQQASATMINKSGRSDA